MYWIPLSKQQQFLFMFYLLKTMQISLNSSVKILQLIKYTRKYQIAGFIKFQIQRKPSMKSLILFISFVFLCGVVYADQSQPLIPGVTPSEVVLAVGQIFPGQINIAQTKQAIHYLHINEIERKFLYIRVSTFDKVRMAIGLYLNESRSIVHACQDNIFDSCYIPGNLLKPNTEYAILIVVDDNIKYNLYTYWGDLEHIKPNQQIKFMFDNTNPTQLFHLQFDQVKQFQQIRMILKPQTIRSKGDNLKIFANIGFKQQPTVQKHQFQSVYVWNDAQAIILNKQQVKQQKGIGIYIVGNAQTVYTFQCQFITQTSHELKIGQILNDYLPKQKSTSYRLNFADNLNVDSFVIKISAFTGQIMVGFYYDKQLTKLAEKSPFQYMSDLQFNFNKQDFAQGTKEIYMKVISMDAQAIYQINPQARNKQVASQITQNVYQFNLMSQNKQALYFHSHVWDSNQFESTKNFKFDISMIKIFGNPQVTYYYCKPDSDQKQCIDINNNDFPQYVTKINPFGVQQIGTKFITTLNLDQSAYKSVNNVEKKLMVIIVIEKKGKQDSVAWALQYSNPSQIRLLRQGRAFEDKVRYLQKRYYKYINNNPQVSQIRIHINQISGLTKIRSKRTPFEKQGPQSTLDKDYPDTIVIKDHITDPIYLQVQGVVTSLYTLSVTAVHSEHLISNALIMAEDVQYQVKLLPYQHMNVQIHPIQSNVVFQFYSEGGSVMVCQVDEKDLCIKDKAFGSHGEVPLDASDSRQIRLRIGNYVQSKLQADPSVKDLPQTINKVKLTLIYHGQRSNHCDQRRINKIYSQNIKKGNCFKFHLPIAADVQIMAIRSDLGQHNNIFILCSSKVVPNLVNDRYVIKKELIKQHCKQAQNQMILQMIITQNSLQSTGQLKMDYSVQYHDDTVTLADGIAYLAKGYSTMQGALRTFFYQILDEDRDVNIVLYNKKGLQKFYIKIANKAERYMVASQADSKLSSKNSNFYMNPHTKISPKDISDANCGRTCVLVISVYSSETAGNQVQYALQITQNHIFLKQDQIKNDFLPKSSARFYEYQSKSVGGSLIFTISDNNRKCTRTLMSKNPFPTNSNSFLKQNEGTIIYQKKNQGTYYFAVQAIDDCPYTVSVSEGKGKVTKIQHGQFFDIKLEQGQVKWFYIRHNTNSTFKVLTLKKYGQMKIYANQTDLSKDALSNIQGNQVSLQKFAFKSTYQNTLAVDFVAKQYCFNCYYFICVKAIKKTQASIFVGGSSSKISLSQNKILFDTIQSKNGLTFANFYRVSDGKMEIKVHSGKISIFMSYSNQKFEKTFEQSRKVYHQNYNFTRQQGIWSPLQIRITAEQAPALYSLQLSPLNQKKLFERKVNPGEHTYLFLGSGQQQCFIGSLTSNQQQIFLSVDTSQKLKLNNLNLVVKLDENVTQSYQKQIVGNILSIRFNFANSLISKANKYEICARTQSKNDTLALSVFQNIDVNLIHSDTQVLVRKQSKFVIYPRNDIILDLFECKGTAEIYYGNKLDEIRQKASSKLDTLGIPGQSHAIRISELSTIYVDVVAEMATVLWMPLKEKEERGIGYFKYAIGNLQFSSQFNSIQFRIGGVYKIKQTSTKPVQVKYTLYVSNSKQLLQEAVMCEKTPLNKLLSSTLTNRIVGNNSHFAITMHMDKKRITDQFSNNETLYFNVVADLTLQPPNNKDEEDHEHYRFIYFQQVVPSEVFRQNKIQTMQITLLIVLAVVSVIGFILISCIFVKCIVPALGKLKNRVLVQQKQDPKDQSMPVPQSSDRNQIGPTSTQDQMK